ncbi:hypothetical protein BCR41DRAFT_93952 [Lobosporangium transversale]|uniref:Uncharacterized protein n=1 Tax=Lobosporangium transversale TaxID=64571 RepID=A0A1Y2GP87_9FUNG|nr:hypothetical protein BCR41DRAFT_93952 [Lobosporangium transversale]ORZ13362.1 hypothetical protein BCR41DRAFT_93952 [Lobosporangium transversale]|eukprot:XP_021880443.1 hypothetical protein BCR41DRAFT_93952 [Lobosporangium transversale]
MAISKSLIATLINAMNVWLYGPQAGFYFFFPRATTGLLFSHTSFSSPLSSFLFPLSSFLFPLSSFLFLFFSFLLSPSTISHSPFSILHSPFSTFLNPLLLLTALHFLLLFLSVILRLSFLADLKKKKKKICIACILHANDKIHSSIALPVSHTIVPLWSSLSSFA